METINRKITIGVKQYSYVLQKRKGQKHIRLKVRKDGILQISAPTAVRLDRVDGFIREKQPWIDTHVEKHKAAADLYNPLKRIPYQGEWYTVNHVLSDKKGVIVIDDTTKILRIESVTKNPDHLKQILRRKLVGRVKKMLPSIIEELAKMYKIPYASYSVRDQKTRWGSSSGRGHISINWRIICVPPQVQKYLIIHELLHQRIPGHQARFWHEMEKIMPGAKTCDRWLKEHDMIMSILR
jgi:predicted metal-dependent hydrolase